MHSSKETSQARPEAKSQAKRRFPKLRVIVNYLIDDMKKAPIQFKIAVFSIFIIVAFIAILVNANRLLLVVFIGMSEQSFGDADLYITAANSNDNQVNITAADFPSMFRASLIDLSESTKRILSVEQVQGAAPRWILPGLMMNPKDPAKNTSVYCFLGDSRTENKYGFGRALKLEPINGSQAYVMNSGVNAIELEDQEFGFRLDLIRVMRELGLINSTSSSSPSSEIDDAAYIRQLVASQLGNSLVLQIPTAQELYDQLGLPAGTPNPFENLTLPTTVNLSTPEVIDSIAEILTNISRIETRYNYTSKFKKSLGKWPETRGNVIFLERLPFLDNIVKQTGSQLKSLGSLITQRVIEDSAALRPVGPLINPIIEQQITSFLYEPVMAGLNAIDLNNTAMTVSVNVADKVDTYGSFVDFQYKLTVFSNKVMAALGDPEKYVVTSLMYFGFSNLGFVAIFIQNIVYMILVLLGIVSIVLLASLMIFGIDERTYEFGMLRALGLERSGLVLMLMLQGTVYAVLGWSLGTVLSWIVAVSLQVMFYSDIRMLLDMEYTAMAWIVAGCFGVLFPILVNIFSIRSALTETLKDSLDLYHRSIGAVTVAIVRLEKLGISRTVFVVAFELALYGFLFYYVAPYFFFYNRFDLFIYMFNAILLATIIALTVIANLLQPPVEVVFVWVCKQFMGRQRPLSAVIWKNLEAHQSSNRKTSLMLALCICFVIFSGSGIHTQVNSIISQVVIFSGSDLDVQTSDDLAPLDEVKLRAFLDSAKIARYVSSYSFITTSLSRYPSVDGVILSPKSFYPTFKATITAVDDRFMDTIYTEYYSPRTYKDGIDYPRLSNGLKDGVTPMFEGTSLFSKVVTDPNKIYTATLASDPPSYTDKLVVKAVMPSGITELTAITSGTPAMLQIDFAGKTIVVDMEVVSTADKLPGMSFSKYTLSIQSSSDIIIPMKSYAQIVDKFKETMLKNGPIAYQAFGTWDTETVKSSSFGLLKNRLLIRLKDDTSEEARDQLKNGLKNLLQSDDSVTDAIDLRNTTANALDYLRLLNVMIAALTCVISFFMLLISLMKKIKDNIWELGVLRSMGLTIKQVYIIYSIETAAVILTAFVLGTGVGLVVSMVGTYFYFIFFEVDLGLGFPWFEFILLLSFLLVTTLFTSYVGLKSFIYQPITRLLRGLV